MRIVGGRARGIQLKSPPGDGVRPSTDALREAIFNHLQFLVAGASFLDLFAGTGAYGLEALSRGAVSGTFVEQSGAVCGLLRTNLATVCRSLNGIQENLNVLCGDAFRCCLVADLVLLDPPYPLARERLSDLFDLLLRVLKRANNSRGVLELPSDLAQNVIIPDELDCLRVLGKKHGKNNPTALIFRWRQE